MACVHLSYNYHKMYTRIRMIENFNFSNVYGDKEDTRHNKN